MKKSKIKQENPDMPLLWNVHYLIELQRRERKDIFDTYHNKGKLPFFPHVGMSIDCDGMCREVESVFWFADTSELTVCFEDETYTSHDYLISNGWVKEG